MLYLGIDQHMWQLTVNLRAEDGTVVLKRHRGIAGHEPILAFWGIRETDYL
jgi:hypothetical protein